MQLISDVHPSNIVRFGNLLVQLMRSDGDTTFAVRLHDSSCFGVLLLRARVLGLLV